MDIVLPVAGLGTRLRPLTWSRPKPLLTVGTKPILGHVLDKVLPLQPEQLVFITGYLGDQIETWARANCSVPTAFVEQTEMRGQTDAIIRVRDIVKHDALILFPDMVFDAEFSHLATTDADVVIFTMEVEDPSALGVAVKENGRVVKLVEKPQEPISHEAQIGIFYFKEMPKLYAAIEEQMKRGIRLKNEYFLADAVQLMIDDGANVVTSPVTIWEDCGKVEELLATNRSVLEREHPPVKSRRDVTVIEPSYVADSATIERAVIGPHASIGEGVQVRDALVRDAIIEAEATIEQTLVEHSLIGERAIVRGSWARLEAADDSTVER